MEDFEREVDVSSRLGSAQVNERALSSHKLFIRAIKEQLFVIEKFLRDKSFYDEVLNLQLVNSNEQDGDVLASFLSGPNAKLQQIEFNHQRKGKGDVHGTSASPHIVQLDEIMEIHPDDTEGMLMNCDNHMDSNLQFMKEDELTGIESQQMKRSVTNSDPFQNGNNRSLFCGYYGVNVDLNKFKARNFLRLSDSVRYFCNFWLPSRSMFVRSYTKRRKDGEVMDNSDLDPEQGRLRSVLDLAQNQQVNSLCHQTSHLFFFFFFSVFCFLFLFFLIFSYSDGQFRIFIFLSVYLGCCSFFGGTNIFVGCNLLHESSLTRKLFQVMH